MGDLLKIVVTGGAGFIGSHFVRELLSDRHHQFQVVVVDSLNYAGNLKNLRDLESDQNFKFVEQDICDPLIPSWVFNEAFSIINFAAESHVDRSIQSSSVFVRTNIQGTHNLLNKALEHSVSRFVQVSTDEVYGSISEGSWDESFPLLPNSPYAASKASADLLVRSFNKTHGLHTNITRCSNNFGTHQYPEKLIPVIISKILAGQKVPIYGDGQNRRDWLHVLDHCRAIKSVMTGGASGDVYNIGGGTELSNLELVRKIIQLMGASENLITFVADRKGHDFRYSVSFKKIEEELGYKPIESIDKSLLKVVDWYIQNENWWEKS
jgi:dTDP-glucose 4,6-dehydratase